MLTDELITLIAIEEVGKLTKRPTSYPMEITYDHINYICDMLVSRGHLVVHRLGEYQLTSKGRNAILGEAIRLVVCGDEAWIKCRMERLEQLYDEINQHLNNLVSSGK